MAQEDVFKKIVSHCKEYGFVFPSSEIYDVPAADLDHIEAYDAATTAPAFEGKWKMKTLNADRAYMEAEGYGMVTYNDTYPSFEADDELTFKDGTLTPNLKSNFKNFFKGVATYEIVGPRTIHPTNDINSAREVTVLKVKGVNRFFDANSISPDDEALIGVRVVEDEDADEAGVMLLEVYLIDYSPKTFGLEWYDWGYFGEDKPNADGGGVTIFFTMSKAQSTGIRKKMPANGSNLSNIEAYNACIFSNYNAVILVGASWCGPYKLIKPAFINYMNSINISNYAFINLTDDSFSTNIAGTYNITTIPTILVFKNYGADSLALPCPLSEWPSVKNQIVQFLGL